ncbi:MAG: DUF4160 domain-containing protein [Bdellovibrionales bacterium]|nr:DUF4160 domain-containing protein [Bdellovibrionales bacterium]
MYWFDTDKHKLPHFHAKYGEFKAVFDLEGKLIEGSLGNRADKLVAEWSELRRDEIHNAWKRAVNGEEIPWVRPIR